jgi:hypothetical protein
VLRPPRRVDRQRVEHAVGLKKWDQFLKFCGITEANPEFTYSYNTRVTLG